jgi:hypothetical protein
MTDAEIALIVQEARYGTDCPVSGNFEASVRDAILAGYRAGQRESVPRGWKLVPMEPTMEMECAYRQALNDYLDRLPPEQRPMARKVGRGGRYKGMRVENPALKLKLRWRAMVSAAPTPSIE